MPKRIHVTLGLSSWQSRHAPASAIRCVNLHAEIQPPGSKAQAPLFRNEGIKTAASFPAAIRGVKRAMRGVLYVVAGLKLYQVDSAGAATVIGSIPGFGRVSMAANDWQLAILNAVGDGFVWNGTTLSEIDDGDFYPSAWAEYFDQYMVFGRLDGSGFAISALDDATSLDALDVATPEVQPDSVIAGIRDHRDLVLFGTDSTELWYNSGASDFPFERTPGGVLEVGCAARHSPAVIDNTTFWLAHEKGGRSIRRLAGGNPQRVSTPAIDDALDAMEDVSDAYGLAWSFGGHAYYALTVGDRTFCYDISTQLWPERRSYGADRWRVTHIEECYGRLYAALDNGVLGTFSRDIHDEAGLPLVWETVSQPVTSDGRVLTYNAFEVEIDAGHGLTTGQGSAPVLSLSWSDDDGRTWSNQYSRPMGRSGQYRNRCRWTNLGCSRGRMFRLTGSEPVQTALIRAFVDVEAAA